MKNSTYGYCLVIKWNQRLSEKDTDLLSTCYSKLYS